MYRTFFDDLFDLVNSIDSGTTTRQTYLASKMTDSGDHYTVKAEIPGFEKSEITLSVEGNYLILDAKNKERATKKSYFIPEQSNKENIAAALKNGILTICIAKKVAEKQSKKIDIKII